MEKISEKQFKKICLLLRRLGLYRSVKREIKGKMTLEDIERSKANPLIQRLEELEKETKTWIREGLNMVGGKLAICGSCDKWEQKDLYGHGTCTDKPWLSVEGNSPAGYKGCFQCGNKPITKEYRDELVKEVLNILGI